MVRYEVIDALAKLRDGHAVEPLIHALHDADPYVRFKAIRALGALGDSKALPTLFWLSQNDLVLTHEGYNSEAATEAIRLIEQNG